MAKGKENNVVSQAEMVKHIRERLKSEYELEASRDLVKAILEIEADEIYMIVAENKAYNYLWGKIGGKSKPPKKVAGKFAEIKSVRDNFGYSTWKNGFPYIEWSKIMKVYDIFPPEDYFALPENRYTTEARQFRRDAKMPEIPEFENLSEEKIQELCAKADKLKTDKLTSRQRSNKMRDDKYNKIKILATQDYWKKNNYIPYRATDLNWDGENRDAIDCYLAHLADYTNAVDKLELVRSARDIAEWKHELEAHPELDELEQQFLQEIQQQGLTPKVHIKKEIADDNFFLKYKGEENPWGLAHVSTLTELKRKRNERDEQLLLQEIAQANNSEKEEKE